MSGLTDDEALVLAIQLSIEQAQLEQEDLERRRLMKATEDDRQAMELAFQLSELEFTNSESIRPSTHLHSGASSSRYASPRSDVSTRSLRGSGLDAAQAAATAATRREDALKASMAASKKRSAAAARMRQ